MANETRELTNSMRSKFAACHRAYKIAYVDMIRPLKTSDALAFGTAMHALLEIYWSPAGHDLEAADAVLSRVEDRYVRAVLWELYQGYVDRYFQADHDLQRLAVEARFDAGSPSSSSTRRPARTSGRGATTGASCPSTGRSPATTAARRRSGSTCRSACTT